MLFLKLKREGECLIFMTCYTITCIDECTVNGETEIITTDIKQTDYGVYVMSANMENNVFVT